MFMETVFRHTTFFVHENVRSIKVEKEYLLAENYKTSMNKFYIQCIRK